VSEDAAAAARRIVAEVLASHGLGGAPETPKGPASPGAPVATHDAPHATAGSSPRTAEAARVGPAATAPVGPAATAPVDPAATAPVGPAATAPVDPAATATDERGDEDAGAIARRIVAQVLGEASAASSAAGTREGNAEPAHASQEPETIAAPGEPARGEPAPDEPAPTVPVATVEARVPDVPAEGLSTKQADGVDVDVVADVPEDTSLSAADIVRRIVAEVTSAEAAEVTDSPWSTLAEEGDDTDEEDGPPPPPTRAEPTRELAGAGPLESESTREVPAQEGPLESAPTREVPAQGGFLESEPTREVPVGGGEESAPTSEDRTRAEDAGGVSPATEPPPDDGAPASLARAVEGAPDKEDGHATESPRVDAGVSVLDREAPVVAEAGFEAVVPVEPAVPVEAESPAAPPPELPEGPEVKPHTLRWLLTSVVGAVALAVLFPLAVGALRSLVSLG
jgi:hypothetical protein